MECGPHHLFRNLKDNTVVYVHHIETAAFIMKTISIQIVSDTVCPWCYVGEFVGTGQTTVSHLVINIPYQISGNLSMLKNTAEEIKSDTCNINCYFNHFLIVSICQTSETPHACIPFNMQAKSVLR